MTAPIGYYVHHQGQGHRDRALILAAALGDRVTLLGTGLTNMPFRSMDLPDDRNGSTFSGDDQAEDRPSALHYAPIGHSGVARRTATIAQWIADTRPALMIVDVSVEVAMLARLASTAVVYVRLAGERNDPAHLDAFRGAAALLAPFHARLETPGTAEWVRTKTCYAPGLCAHPARAPRNNDQVLVVCGRGGAALDVARVVDAANAASHQRWRVLGPVSGTLPPVLPANLELAGWAEDVGRQIAAAGIVVGAAGDGVVNQVLAAGTPFVCIPELRPFDEQRTKARALARAGAATVVDDWPAPGEWSAVLEAARAQPNERRRSLDDPEGPARAAAFISDLAAGISRRERLS